MCMSLRRHCFPVTFVSLKTCPNPKAQRFGSRRENTENLFETDFCKDLKVLSSPPDIVKTMLLGLAQRGL